MSEPITSVTEGRVTVTANDTEENIRAAAGFDEAGETETETKPASTETAKSAGTIERDEAGKFKAKADEPTKPAEKPKVDGNPRTSYQAKINLLTAEREDAKRRADEAERRLTEREAEYQARSQPVQPAAAPVQPSVTATNRYLADVQRYQSEPDAPKFDDFVAANLDDPYTAHRDAMSMYIADRRQQEYQERASQQAEQSTRQGKIHDALAIAAERHPEFPALMQSTTQVYPDAVMDVLRLEAVQDPDLSAELFHHLLTHPEDAARLALMASPIAAAREVGRLTTLVSAPSGPEPTSITTTAKPLIKPVRPSVMASGSASPDDLPFGPRYIAAMNEQERKARAQRA